MAKIIINRSSEFANSLRSIDIYLNNKKIGEIKDGESKEFDVSQGQYSLQAKIDWCGSNSINLNVGENDIFRYNVSGRNPFLALFYVLFGKDQYLELKAIN